ncbi:MAG: FG-GAP-like repeat-containing protein [Planctomycetota bacterium]
MADTSRFGGRNDGCVDSRGGDVVRSRLRSLAARVVFVLPLLLAACGDDEAPKRPAAPGPDAIRLARARAAAYFAGADFAGANEALQPLLARSPIAGEDHVRAGIVIDAMGGPGAAERAREHFEAALAQDADDASAHYVLGVLLQAGEPAKALEHLERARALAPDDYATALQLGQLLGMLGRHDEAAAIYEELQALGVDTAGSWHLATLYGLAQARMQQGRRSEGMALLEEFKELQGRGLAAPSGDAVRRGNLGALRAPLPEGHTTAKPLAPHWDRASRLPGFEGASHVLARTLVDDWIHVDSESFSVFRQPGEATCIVRPPDLLGWGPGGLLVARHEEAGYQAPEVVHAGAVQGLATGDLDGDGSLDLVYVTADGVELRFGSTTGWRPPEFALPSLPSLPADIAPVDADHDGDLDLLLVGAFGARLWRNDGVAEGGALVDAGPDTGLGAAGALAWCVVEDFDTDQDVDFLLGGPGTASLLADNLRGGRFRLVDVGLGAQAARPAAADMDADGRPDLLLAGAPGALRRGLASGGFGPRVELPVGLDQADILDLDLDGVPDAFAGRGQAAGGVLAPATAGRQAYELPHLESTGAALAADTDGDRRLDLLVPTQAGLERFTRTPPTGGAFLLALRGTKDNRRGVGAVVEILSGSSYQRLFWTGEPTLVGLGDGTKADVTRITWPNGVIQYDLDTEAGCARLIEQAEGLVGSCPFLYTWDGERYVFVTDVLGITPLGLPMAPGMLVPPDHDEYVLVRGDQLAPRQLEDGSSVYELQLTEELREVTYLDRAKLLVVDHPADTTVQPNERFSFPPFPEPHLHVVRPSPPVRRAVAMAGTGPPRWLKTMATTRPRSSRIADSFGAGSAALRRADVRSLADSRHGSPPSPAHRLVLLDGCEREHGRRTDARHRIRALCCSSPMPRPGARAVDPETAGGPRARHRIPGRQAEDDGGGRHRRRGPFRPAAADRHDAAPLLGCHPPRRGRRPSRAGDGAGTGLGRPVGTGLQQARADVRGARAGVVRVGHTRHPAMEPAPRALHPPG